MILRCESTAISFLYLQPCLFVPFFRPVKSPLPIKRNADFKPAPAATGQSLLKLICSVVVPVSLLLMYLISIHLM